MKSIKRVKSKKSIKSKKKFSTKSLVLCSLFSALIAIGAFIRIPVPFMDYFTLQFLFVILAGFVLGSKLGAISVAIYVVVGLIGFPVFAAGGGIQYIFRPSFGYLLGFIICAFLVGFICEKTNATTFKYYLASALVGMIVTYAIGFTYKYLILNFYTKEVTSLFTIVLASIPLDIPGDIVLCFVGAGLGNRLNKVLKR